MDEENYEVGQTTEEGTSEVGTDDGQVEPVKLSKKKVGFILIAFILVLIIVILALSRTSISKSVDSKGSSAEGNYTIETVTPNYSGNGNEEPQISIDFVPNSGEASTSSQTEATTSEFSESGQEVVSTIESSSSEPAEKDTVETVTFGVIESSTPEESISDSVFEEISIIPALGSEITTQGMVTGTAMYKIENSYTFGIRILIVTGNGTNVECLYFCPKGTYDKLAVGDSLNVMYSMDAQGNICVVSISR